VRTDAEIVARIEARMHKDPFGFEWPYYLVCLPFELAKPYLIEESKSKPADWKQAQRDEESLRTECIDYMPFAWDKANNCRGISANRSIAHFQAWLWLMGVEWADSLWDDYEYYGKPQLVRICEFLGVDHKQWDDGVRTNGEDE